MQVTIDPPPGALGAVIRLHAEWYAAHWGFGLRFEAKVAAGLGDFARALPHPDSRLFLAVEGGRVLGSLAIDGRDRADVRLRWFIVAEEARGGLGRRLLEEALGFCRERGFAAVTLGTFAGLDAARRLYERAGFVLEHEAPAAGWGVTVNEQRFRLRLADGLVTHVATDGTHRFSKTLRESIRLLAGLGVEGDAHAGVTVQHRSRVARDPTQPNLRQVHLTHAELFEELRTRGFDIAPAAMGENITTRGLDLLGLPRGARLRIGGAVVEVTGLRNPCRQLDEYRPGLMAATLDRDTEGNLIRKAGVMGVVLEGGEVRPGDAIRVELPDRPHEPLAPV
jgi:GNAT superfamily N-acetyltransferase